MSWKRYFRAVDTGTRPATPPPQGFGGIGTSSKFSSYLPEIYAGHPNRVQRYYQYDDMDKDSDINAALDTIADFCTQSEEQNDEPFNIHYTGDVNETEVTILKEALAKWAKLNEFRSRLWHIFRSTIKNGDNFFLRDPETMEWLWIDTFMVEMVKVDDAKGKDPDEYIIRGLDYNKSAKFATKGADPLNSRSPLGVGASGGRGSSGQGGMFTLAGGATDPRQRNLLKNQGDQLSVVNAEHVVHLSLSVGMDINWPFGASILEPVFKVFKQKELLEDAVIIYRVQRAPERRIFYIDTGSMPPQRAKAHIEQIKNEIHQRRIPSRSGGGASMMDAAYNPLSTLDDYYFASSCIRLNAAIPLLDGRTLSLSELIAEHENGQQNFTYSLDVKTGKFEPGRIAWAGITRKNAEMVRVTLDSGEYVDVTPDHRFITRDGQEVCAIDLQPDQSLMPLDHFDVCTNHLQDLPNVDNSTIIRNVFQKLCKIVGKVFLKTIINTLHTALAALRVFRKRVRVASVARLTEREDTGDLTIESASNSHVFALGIGVYVHNSDGRGSKVETLPGGEMTGEVGDLLLFSKKLARGLRIPTSYLALGGDEEAGGTYNDGKLGAAMIQEFRFNKYCMRIQSLLAPMFDKEFKRFLRKTGIEIESNLFELHFMPPQNFTKYRQIELDAQQVQVYTQIAENARLSERFKLKRFLNLTDEELLENEKLWSEENAAKLKKRTGSTPAEGPSEQGLGSVGVRSGGGFDMDMGEPGMDAPPDDGAAPDGGAGMGGGGDPGMGGAPPPAGGAPAGPEG